MSEDKMISMDRHSADAVAAGQAAWVRLKKQETWADWLAIGRAIEAGRNAMMNYLRTNSPAGRVWSEKFGQWLKETGFDQIDKAIRSKLQSCMDELPAIEAWRVQIGLAKSMQYNHPATVLAKFRADTKPRVEKEKGEKAEKAKTNAEMAAERLIEATEAAADRLEKEQFMLDIDDPEAAADAFIAYYGEAKAKRFADFVSFLLLEKVAPDVARRVAGAPELPPANAIAANAAGAGWVAETDDDGDEGIVVEVLDRGALHHVNATTGEAWVMIGASTRNGRTVRKAHLQTITDKRRIKRLVRIAAADWAAGTARVAK